MKSHKLPALKPTLPLLDVRIGRFPFAANARAKTMAQIEGAVKMLEPELSGDFGTLMQWADETRRLKVRTNADTPADARVARKFGGERQFGDEPVRRDLEGWSGVGHGSLRQGR